MTHADWIAKYDRPVPRYTSYPTAPHFNADIGPETTARWLATLPERTPVGVYLHVPFCRKLCWYCGCTTKVVNSGNALSRYADTLCAEIALAAAHMADRPTVSHLHWGGGTPNHLPIEQLSRILGTLRAHANLAPGFEHAMEIDPRSVDSAAHARQLMDLGLTRASLGVQDFNDTVQHAINRVQPYELVADVVAQLRQAGLPHLNLDLMYGLPHQTPDTVRATVALALRLKPDRLALFGYAHVPWAKPHQKLLEESPIPDARARAQLFDAAQRALTDAGYVRIGIDHFARPDDPLAQALAAGTLRRNFQGYTTDPTATLLGFGASSISTYPQGYAQNAVDTKAYAAAVDSGHLATVKGYAWTADDRLRKAIIDDLMCHHQVDVAHHAAAHGQPVEVLQPALDRLAPLAADGLLTCNGTHICMAADGALFTRVAAAAFDTYLTDGGPPRHARAV